MTKTQQLTLTTLMIAVTGGVAGLWMLQSVEWAMGCSLGAAVGGTVSARLFGSAGSQGWLCAAVGAVLSTSIGAACVGIVMAGPMGGVMAAWMVFAGLLSHWGLSATWVFAMGFTHLAARKLQISDKHRQIANSI